MAVERGKDKELCNPCQFLGIHLGRRLGVGKKLLFMTEICYEAQEFTETWNLIDKHASQMLFLRAYSMSRKLSQR